jgi:NAD dependent epimerase/dehydratase family enzyme
MILPFSLGIGGPLAGGRQWMPLMSLYDWVSAVAFLLERNDIAGPVNLVGPEPVRNAEFTKALGRALHRPAIAPIPRIALRVLLGEFADQALANQRVLPRVLNRAGFTFAHPDPDSALRAAFKPDLQH